MTHSGWRQGIVTITYEKLVIALMLLLSLPNTFMLIASSILLALYMLVWQRKRGGAVKALIFIAMRTPLSTGVAATYENYAIVKWALLLGLSLYIVLTNPWPRQRLARRFLLLIAGLSLYIIFIGLFNSDYPVTSAFKVFSWAFVLSAVIVGVLACDRVDWTAHMCWYLNLILLLSPLSWALGIAYLRNGRGYQGLLNHPNMMGVIASICFTLNLYLMQERRESGRTVFLLLAAVQGVLSLSRTGVISMVLSFIAFTLFVMKRGWKKTLTILLSFMGIAALIIFGFGDSVIDFIYKGRSVGELFYSREGQIARYMEKFHAHPLFGSGFMVPQNSAGKSFVLSFELSIEPGNLIIALLGDLGIVGTILFFVPYIVLLRHMDKRKLSLFLLPFIVSMGEMIFFSTNNTAILYYVLYAVCLLPGKKRRTAHQGLIRSARQGRYPTPR